MTGSQCHPLARAFAKFVSGALMGHLGVAKRKLEVDSTIIEKQSALQMAVLKKNDLENRRLQLLQKEASTSYKAKVVSILLNSPCAGISEDILFCIF